MDCQELKDNMDRYLDRELSVERSAAVEHHLAHCAECWAEYGPLVDFLAARPRVRVPDGLSHRIIEATLRSSRQEEKRFASSWKWAFWPAAAAVVLLALGWWLMPAPKHGAGVAGSQPSPEAMAPPNPWILGSLIQSVAVAGPAAPLAATAQASITERLAALPVAEAPELAYIHYRSRVREISVPDVPRRVVNAAVFSSLLGRL